MNHAREDGFAEVRYTDDRIDGFAQGFVAGSTEGHEKERQRLLILLNQGMSVKELKKYLSQGIED